LNSASKARARALASVVLPTPGHVLHEDVSPADEGGQEVADHLGLAQDDLPELGLEGRQDVAGLRGEGYERHGGRERKGDAIPALPGGQAAEPHSERHHRG
jgi:hypothetical protein